MTARHVLWGRLTRERPLAMGLSHIRLVSLFFPCSSSVSVVKATTIANTMGHNGGMHFV